MHYMIYVREILFRQERIVTLIITALTFKSSAAYVTGISVHTSGSLCNAMAQTGTHKHGSRQVKSRGHVPLNICIVFAPTNKNIKVTEDFYFDEMRLIM